MVEISENVLCNYPVGEGTKKVVKLFFFFVVLALTHPPPSPHPVRGQNFVVMSAKKCTPSLNGHVNKTKKLSYRYFNNGGRVSPPLRNFGIWQYFFCHIISGNLNLILFRNSVLFSQLEEKKVLEGIGKLYITNKTDFVIECA